MAGERRRTYELPPFLGARQERAPGVVAVATIGGDPATAGLERG